MLPLALFGMPLNFPPMKTTRRQVGWMDELENDEYQYKSAREQVIPTGLLLTQQLFFAYYYYEILNARTEHSSTHILRQDTKEQVGQRIKPQQKEFGDGFLALKQLARSMNMQRFQLELVQHAAVPLRSQSGHLFMIVLMHVADLSQLPTTLCEAQLVACCWYQSAP